MYYLIAGCTSNTGQLTIMTATVYFVVFVKVQQIYQHLFACFAHETVWMPAFICSHTVCKYRDLSTIQLPFAMLTNLYSGLEHDINYC